MQASSKLVLIVCLTSYVWGAPSTQLAVFQDKLKISPQVINSIENIIEDQVRSSVVNAYLGLFPEVAATSCKEIADNKPDYHSGYYWISGPAGPVGVYCEMDAPFRQGGGWMRVAAVNMNDTQTHCPSGLVLNTTSNKRMCRRTEYFINGGCGSTVFPVHNTRYKKVCGKVIGYQGKSPNGFGPARFTPLINETYLDGVSLTHGDPRKHIWSFAAAYGDDIDTSVTGHSGCPCNAFSQTFDGTIPSFVGSDYYCETGNRNSFNEARKKEGLFTDDPLWDGKGCAGTNMCCDRGGPWFCKELDKATTDNIELRICLNERFENEDIMLEAVTIYVQ